MESLQWNLYFPALYLIGSPWPITRQQTDHCQHLDIRTFNAPQEEAILHPSLRPSINAGVPS